MTPYRVTLHCSDTPNGKTVPVAEIRKWHLARGMKDIGYHVLIQPDGTVEAGRELDTQGAHVEGDNAGNIGVCFIGRDKYTAGQWASLRRLLKEYEFQFKIRPWEIRGHRDFPSAQKQGKSCPNVEIGRIICWYVGEWEEAIAPHMEG